MNEETVALQTTDGVTLEGRLSMREREHGAVICHPHPLYGGSMDNNVVLAARDALRAAGLSTLRFNFRGVGGSSGSFDGGRGERKDVEAAHAHLSGLVDHVHLVAYSFGAWVALGALAERGFNMSSVILVSPPVAFAETDFAELPPPSVRTLVVSGDQDQFGPPDAVKRWLDVWERSDELERVVLTGVDHFYWGGEEELKDAIERFMAS